VRDHVVQLARDPGPLRGRGQFAEVFPFAFQRLGALRRDPRVPGCVPHQSTDASREAEVHDRNDHVRRTVQPPCADHGIHRRQDSKRRAVPDDHRSP